MRDLPAVDGSWPGRLTIRRGWARAEARPWSDTWPGSQLRLVRGGHDFLEAAARRLIELGAGPVHSPALFPSSTPVWERAGFAPFQHLLVMERDIHETSAADPRVAIRDTPPWDDMLSIDGASFEGFWRMGRVGLEEAIGSTRRSAIFAARGTGDDVAGFAVAGLEHGFSYLQRLAVDPSARRRGLGRALVNEAMGWAARGGGRLMVLNVQPDAHPARRLYESLGFTDTGTLLEVMRWPTPY